MHPSSCPLRGQRPKPLTRRAAMRGLLAAAAGLAAGTTARADDDSVSLDAARAALEAGSAVLIDVREPGETATGVAPGAQLLPMRQLGQRLAEVPTTGRAHCVTPVHQPATPVFSGETLRIGDGLIAGISKEVQHFRTAGLPVARHFVTSRLGGGRTSSALDDGAPWTEETTAALLENLWRIEHLLALAPTLADWLDRVLAGPRISRFVE